MMIIEDINTIDNYFIKTLLTGNQCASMAACPIYCNNKYYGYISFSTLTAPKKWTSYEIQVLLGLSVVISQAVMNHGVKKMLRYEKEQLEVTLLSISDGVIITDKNGHIQLMNQAAEEILEKNFKTVKDQYLGQIINVYEETFQQYCRKVFQENKEEALHYSFPQNTRLQTISGNEKNIEGKVDVIKDNGNGIIGRVMVFRDVTVRISREKKITYLSQMDALTGLYNRGYTEQLLKEINDRDHHSLTIIMGDLNGLKMTNDFFGHQEGDERLRQIGRIINESCRGDDVAGRWGGDEFLIILENAVEQDAKEICKRIKDKCENLGGEVAKYCISLGYAMKHKEDKSIKETIKRAEDHMYNKKEKEAARYKIMILEKMKLKFPPEKMKDLENQERFRSLSKEIGHLVEASDA